MSKILYLMGAGASRGKRDEYGNILEGLPVVSEIPEQLEKTISQIEAIEFVKEVIRFQWNEINLPNLKRKLIEDLNWLAEESSRHATIDTFARKLYLTDKISDYNRLKWALSSFFMIQEIVNKIDGRYDTFLANVLEKPSDSSLEISQDVTIVTWNYDSCFEIALSLYVGKLDVPSDYGVEVFAKNVDLIKSKLRYPPSKRVYKINGSASFSLSYSLGKYCGSDASSFTENSLIDLLKLYSQENGCLLNFAWDSYNQNYQDPNWNILRNELTSTETLVVVGYTFPFFNRNIDRELFSKMPKLKSIYYQDPNADNLLSNIWSVLTESQKCIKVVPIKNVDQFYIPAGEREQYYQELKHMVNEIGDKDNIYKLKYCVKIIKYEKKNNTSF